MPACSSNVPARDRATIEAAARIVATGGLIVYPTETLYGLGADAFNEAALHRLVDLKGREPGKPIAVLISDANMLEQLTAEIPDTAAILMRRFWPGPLTLVLHARPALSPLLTGGTHSIGARISSHPVAQALTQAVQRPLTAPSANPAGMHPPTQLAEARAYFGARVDAYIDGGTLHGEPPSTVIDVRDTPRILRAGAISTEALQTALGHREIGAHHS